MAAFGVRVAKGGARTRGAAFKHARRGRATGRRDFGRRVRMSRSGDVTLASRLALAVGSGCQLEGETRVGLRLRPARLRPVGLFFSSSFFLF